MSIDVLDIKVRGFSSYRTSGQPSWTTFDGQSEVVYSEALHGQSEVSLYVKDGDKNVLINSLNIFIYPTDKPEEVFYGTLWAANEKREFPKPSLSFCLARDVFNRLKDGKCSELEMQFEVDKEKHFNEGGGFQCSAVARDYTITELFGSTQTHLSRRFINQTCHIWHMRFGPRIKDIGQQILYHAKFWLESHPEKQVDIKVTVAHIESILSELENCYPPEEGKGRENYSSLWRHKDINQIISSGRIHDNNYLAYQWQSPTDIQVGSLENVARIYANAEPWVRSHELDYMLVDAMLFVDTASYARITAKTPKNKYLNILGFVVWTSFKKFFKEGFALALTALFATLFDSNHGTVFWIVFATITLGRWLDPAKAFKLHVETKPKILMHEMNNVYSRWREDFNPRLIRELLYDLECKGAYYNPLIYTILDRMVERQGTNYLLIKAQSNCTYFN
jgi:hypothetical protein